MEITHFNTNFMFQIHGTYICHTLKFIFINRILSDYQTYHFGFFSQLGNMRTLLIYSISKN